MTHTHFFGKLYNKQMNYYRLQLYKYIQYIQIIQICYNCERHCKQTVSDNKQHHTLFKLQSILSNETAQEIITNGVKFTTKATNLQILIYAINGNKMMCFGMSNAQLCNDTLNNIVHEYYSPAVTHACFVSFQPQTTH